MKNEESVKTAKVLYAKPMLINYGSLKAITQAANQNGNGALNHIDKKGTPGTVEHGGLNHQYKHHGLSVASMAMFAVD